MARMVTMVRLESLHAGTRIRGLTPEGVSTVKSVNWFGDHGAEVIFSFFDRH